MQFFKKCIAKLIAQHLGIPTSSTAPTEISEIPDWPFPRQTQGDQKNRKKTQQQKQLDFCRELFADVKKKGISYVFVISSERNWYHTIKAAADMEGVQTTLTLRSHNSVKTSDPEVANLLLKFNLKIGGINWTLNMDEFPNVLKARTTCFFGVDVVHPPPGARPGSPSVAGVVSSTEPQPGQFTGKIATHLLHA